MVECIYILSVVDKVTQYWVVGRYRCTCTHVLIRECWCGFCKYSTHKVVCKRNSTIVLGCTIAFTSVWSFCLNTSCSMWGKQYSGTTICCSYPEEQQHHVCVPMEFSAFIIIFTQETAKSFGLSMGWQKLTHNFVLPSEKARWWPEDEACESMHLYNYTMYICSEEKHLITVFTNLN